MREGTAKQTGPQAAASAQARMPLPAGASNKAKPMPPIRLQRASGICINTMISPALRKQVPYHERGIDGLSFQISRALSHRMEAMGIPTLDADEATTRLMAGLSADGLSRLCPDDGVNIIVRQLVDVNAQGQPYRIRLDARQGAVRWSTEIERKGDRSDWPSIPPIPDYGVSASMAIDEDSYMLGERLADYLFEKDKSK